MPPRASVVVLREFTLMSLSRRNPRRDANEQEIVDSLRAVGADVTRVSGAGAPDVLVRFCGRLYAFELKTAKGRPTEAQARSGWPIVRTREEALYAIGMWPHA